MKITVIMKLITMIIGGFLILDFGVLKAQDKTDEAVKWISFEEAVEKSTVEKRKIFIDVYTDWCGWCKVMDKKTFNQPVIADYLNEHYYPVKLNAEQKEDIVFRGQTFKFVPSGRTGYHELAAALLQNKLSYPTFVILNENFEIINITPGYIKEEPFHKIISFFSKDHHTSKELARKFEEGYRSPFK